MKEWFLHHTRSCGSEGSIHGRNLMFLKVPRRYGHRKEGEPTKLGLMEVKICMDEDEGNLDR